jgi:chemotaxis protein methyltransferase CheR
LSLKILTICDTGSFGTYLNEVLTAKGHTVSPAAQGKEAFRAIRLNRPDLIIIEVEAAKSGVLASEQHLHAPEGPCKIPVIVISDSRKLEAELLHIFDFLPKPLDLNRLLDDVAAISARPATTESRAALSDQNYLEFSSHILSCTGLHFELRNRTSLERGLRKRMSVLRLDSFADYLAFLKLHGESRHELQKLLQFLTVGETYFFRYPAHFAALRERISCAAARPPEKIRIWSAGCSTGEEPYSIAISVMEALPDWRTRDIKIFATDINNQSIKKARDGVYSPWAMRTTDPRCRERYFDRVGQSSLIKDEVKQLVEFFHLNLSCDSYAETCPELTDLDAIFCRNVMIYFSPEAAASMVDNFAASLKPSGQLFLGHAETLFQRSSDLEIRRQDNSFYYCKTDESRAGTLSTDRHTSLPPSTPRPTRSTLTSAPAAVDTRSQMPPRVRVLPSPAGPAPTPAARLARAQELFDAEDFNGAELLLAALLSEFPNETGALVLKGFLLAGNGRFQEALDICRRALGLNDLLAEAYFLKGVVLDASDHPTEAADEYRKALLLDHDFIMPRYHMGRLHQRFGREAEAAREIRNSIRILAKRDDEGTVPYSGGLTRSVCMVQLQNALVQVA